MVQFAYDISMKGEASKTRFPIQKENKLPVEVRM